MSYQHSLRFPVLTALFAGTVFAVGALVPSGAQAASHREAPFITSAPKVDGTDFYMFRSYEPGREGHVTLIADYVPFQTPYGGPNFFQLDENALYEIHVDNNGDAKEDMSFQFRFKNNTRNLTVPVGGKNIAVPLINIGAVTGEPEPRALRFTTTIGVGTTGTGFVLHETAPPTAPLVPAQPLSSWRTAPAFLARPSLGSSTAPRR